MAQNITTIIEEKAGTNFTTEQIADIIVRADQGSPEDMFILSELYYRGEGVPQSVRMHIDLLEKLVEADFTPAISRYGEACLQDQFPCYNPQKGFELIHRAIDLGSAMTMHPTQQDVREEKDIKSEDCGSFRISHEEESNKERYSHVQNDDYFDSNVHIDYDINLNSDEISQLHKGIKFSHTIKDDSNLDFDQWEEPNLINEKPGKKENDK